MQFAVYSILSCIFIKHVPQSIVAKHYKDTQYHWCVQLKNHIKCVVGYNKIRQQRTNTQSSLRTNDVNLK